MKNKPNLSTGFGRLTTSRLKTGQSQSLVKDLIALVNAWMFISKTVKNSCDRLWALLQCFSENFDKPGERKAKCSARPKLRTNPKNLLGIMPAKEGKIDLKHSFYGSAFLFLPQRKETKMIETNISRVIIEQYTKRLTEHLENDVVVVGAGPAGLAASYYLAKAGAKTTVIEKKLSIGGGIWGGAAGYNVVTFPAPASAFPTTARSAVTSAETSEDKDILDEIGVTAKKIGDLYAADAIEFATALAYKAKKAGAEIFNLIEVEDIVLKQETVKGVVVNSASVRTLGLHVDPYCICATYVIDATGHPAELISILKKRKPELFPKELQEYFMNVEKSEAGVVEKTGEVFPGLYVAGMSVCDVFNLPRMGPIFGGMLKSGKKVAELINKKMQTSNT